MTEYRTEEYSYRIERKTLVLRHDNLDAAVASFMSMIAMHETRRDWERELAKDLLRHFLRNNADSYSRVIGEYQIRIKTVGRPTEAER